MLRIPLCDLLGIELQITQAAMSVFALAELVVAASNAGAWALSIGYRRPSQDLAR